MYRNLNHAPDGKRILGTPLVGTPGRLIPMTGGNYPSLLANDQTQPQDANLLLRMSVVSHDFPPGTLFVHENGSLTLTAQPDGTYSMLYIVEYDGVQSTVDIGYGPGRAVFTLQVGGTTAEALPFVPLANFDRWLPFVLPFAPNCPTETAIHHIRQAAIEFCELTHAWQQDLSPVLSIAGVDEYAMGVPPGAAAVKLFAFAADGVSGATVDTTAGRREVAWKRNSLSAWVIDRQTVGINPAPASDGIELRFMCSLKPTQAATEVPETLFENYADEITTGALYRLLRVPRQAWTDTSESGAQKTLFDAAVSRVQWRVQQGFARTARRTVAVWF
jgi:hypothetical protein